MHVKIWISNVWPNLSTSQKLNGAMSIQCLVAIKDEYTYSQFCHILDCSEDLQKCACISEWDVLLGFCWKSITVSSHCLRPSGFAEEADRRSMILNLARMSLTQWWSMSRYERCCIKGDTERTSGCSKEVESRVPAWTSEMRGKKNVPSIFYQFWCKRIPPSTSHRLQTMAYPGHEASRLVQCSKRFCTISTGLGRKRTPVMTHISPNSRGNEVTCRLGQTRRGEQIFSSVYMRGPKGSFCSL